MKFLPKPSIKIAVLLAALSFFSVNRHAAGSFIPDHLFDEKLKLHLNKPDDFALYYGYLVPKYKRDVIGESYDRHYDKKDFHGRIPAKVHSVARTPLSYLTVLNRAGKLLRERVIETYGIDLAEIKKSGEHHQQIRGNVTAIYPYIDIKNLSDDVIEGMNRIFVDILTNVFLKPRGIERPVFFAGFVPSETANYYAAYHTFLDDSLFSGSTFHGKYPHTLQIITFLEKTKQYQSDLELLIAQGYWGKLFDSATYYKTQVKRVDCCEWIEGRYFPCQTDPHEIMNGHSAAIVTQWLYRRQFSKIIEIANKKRFGFSAKTLFDFIGHKTNETYILEEEVNDMNNNLRSVENLVALDLNNDIRTVYHAVQEHQKNMADKSYLYRFLDWANLTQSIYQKKFKTGFIIGFFFFTKFPSHTTAIWKRIPESNTALWFAIATQQPYYNERFFHAFIANSEYLLGFHATQRKMLQPTRRRWLSNRPGYEVIEDKGEYIIYRDQPAPLLPPPACPVKSRLWEPYCQPW